MINLFWAIVVSTIGGIGWIDRQSGLALLQQYYLPPGRRMQALDT